MRGRKELLRACFNLGLKVLEMQRAVAGLHECEAYRIYKQITEELNKPVPNMVLVTNLIDGLQKLVK